VKAPENIQCAAIQTYGAFTSMSRSRISAPVEAEPSLLDERPPTKTYETYASWGIRIYRM
jgi:hypothetical protein